VFLDENNLVKLGDFGLSKVLTQASLANTYVGVCGSLFAFNRSCLTGPHTDTLLHVTRANAREGVRLEVRYLVVRMPYLRIMRA
jgi:serine/threonine protein kinase